MATRSSSGKAVRLLAELRRLGIRIWSEDERLRISAPRGVATPEIQEELSRHKHAILELLRDESSRSDSSAPSFS